MATVMRSLALGGMGCVMQGHLESVCLCSNDCNKRLIPWPRGRFSRRLSGRALKRYMDSEIPQVPFVPYVPASPGDQLEPLNRPESRRQTVLLLTVSASSERERSWRSLTLLPRSKAASSRPVHPSTAFLLVHCHRQSLAPIHDMCVVLLMGSHKKCISSWAVHQRRASAQSDACAVWLTAHSRGASLVTITPPSLEASGLLVWIVACPLLAIFL
jgi:hypothetical protein